MQTLMAELVQFSNIYSKSKSSRDCKAGECQRQKNSPTLAKQICQGAGKKQSPGKSKAKIPKHWVNNRNTK